MHLKDLLRWEVKILGATVRYQMIGIENVASM
mgnify:CR=1 FL=1